MADHSPSSPSLSLSKPKRFRLRPNTLQTAHGDSPAFQHAAELIWEAVFKPHSSHYHPSYWARCCKTFVKQRDKNNLGHSAEDITNLTTLKKKEKLQTPGDLLVWLKTACQDDAYSPQLILPSVNMVHPGRELKPQRHDKRKKLARQPVAQEELKPEDLKIEDELPREQAAVTSQDVIGLMDQMGTLRTENANLLASNLQLWEKITALEKEKTLAEKKSADLSETIEAIKEGSSLYNELKLTQEKLKETNKIKDETFDACIVYWNEVHRLQNAIRPLLEYASLTEDKGWAICTSCKEIMAPREDSHSTEGTCYLPKPTLPK